MTEVTINQIKEELQYSTDREEIAAVIDMTIEEFREFEKENPEIEKLFLLAERKNRLRLKRYQWEAAAEGKVPMLTWLGKQYLGQSDKANSDQDDHEEQSLSPEQIQNIAKLMLDSEK